MVDPYRRRRHRGPAAARRRRCRPDVPRPRRPLRRAGRRRPGRPALAAAADRGARPGPGRRCSMPHRASGGQFWRHRPRRDRGPRLPGLARLRRTTLHCGGTRGLRAGRDRVVRGGRVRAAHHAPGGLAAARLVLATGAYDRALPFPGWDLPGVVTRRRRAGAAQGVRRRVGRGWWWPGRGRSCCRWRSGWPRPGRGWSRSSRRAQPGRLPAPPGSLAGLAGKLARGGAVTRRRWPGSGSRTGCGHAVVAAHGGAAGVCRGGRRPAARARHGARRVACDAVAVGYGFTANLELALALGCGTRSGADGGLAVMVDGDGQTTVPGVYAAGEVTGVGGSALALAEGELAGLDRAARHGGGRSLSDRELAGLRRRRTGCVRSPTRCTLRTPRRPGGRPVWTTTRSSAGARRSATASCGAP